MDERDFLTLAHSLSQAPSEAAWRSAVSRAYYAAFHGARRMFDDFGFRVPRGEQAHGYLWLRLSNSGDPSVENAGQLLQSLRSDRNSADYDLNRMLTLPVVRKAIQKAEDVLLALDAASREPTRTQITNAMKLYERDALKNVTWQP